MARPEDTSGSRRDSGLEGLRVDLVGMGGMSPTEARSSTRRNRQGHLQLIVSRGMLKEMGVVKKPSRLWRAGMFLKSGGLSLFLKRYPEEFK